MEINYNHESCRTLRAQRMQQKLSVYSKSTVRQMTYIYRDWAHGPESCWKTDIPKGWGVEDCHCIGWRGSMSTGYISKELSKSVFHCSVISCEFPATIFIENTIGKCSQSIHKVLLSFSSSQHPFVWLLKAPQLSGAMLLFDCFLSPELLLVKILAAALVGTFRELPIGSQELRLARAETLSNDGGRNWCFGCLVCNVESFSTIY